TTGWQQGDSKSERGGTVGWLADAKSVECELIGGGCEKGGRREVSVGKRRSSSGMGNAGRQPGQRDAGSVRGSQAEGRGPRRPDGYVGHGHSDAGDACGLADAESERRNGRESSSWAARRDCFEDSGDIGRPRPTNGFWRDADWLFCRDGKWRPVEPGTLPLAHGAPARAGRLRAYGNAIVAPQAQAFIEAYLASVSV